ncbi:hypothetical protein C8J57DRAFT_1713576 [Mycena rebaudengoi]|nr:hypothetical protein C8J57DRAFT_1713576 [Mycena rebaudengoi]
MSVRVAAQLRDLVHNARIDWEIPWKDTPAAAKAALFEVARERPPYLAEFQNDWATEEIVKQYIKNKRNNAYKKEYITVPTKYAYLKVNAAKRDLSAPRGKKSRVKKVDAAKSAGKKRNKAVAAKPARSSKSHGKRKAVEPTSSDEDEEMLEAGGSGSQGGDDDEYAD